MRYISTKIIPLGSCAFRQWRAVDSHCKFIHGYRLLAKVWLTADKLDKRNWVYDFGSFKPIKDILEKQFDHTMCVAADDPELDTFKSMHDKGLIDLRIMIDGVGIEKTAEFVYKAVDKYVNLTTDGRVRVIKVEVWEHENNSAIYEYTDPTSDVVNPVDTIESPVQTTESPVEPTEPQRKEQAVPRTRSEPTGNPFHNAFKGTSWG